MRNIIIKSFCGCLLAGSLASCSDSWLETDIFSGIDSETALSNAENVSYALNGCYYEFQYYPFAGNYATMVGDIASDIVYWNGDNAHQNSEYQFTYNANDLTLGYIWQYGYIVINNAAAVIVAADNLKDNTTDAEAADLMLYEAEARCLRAYCNLNLVNVFGHQVKVDGVDYSSEPGIVLAFEPIAAFAEVTRASVGETYDFIVDDLKEAISLFEIVGDRGSMNYFGAASAYGLLARTYLYLEDWSNAAQAAAKAIEISGINTLAYTNDAYAALYAGTNTNKESIFALGITSLTNWSANSCGTLFTTYGYSVSPYLFSLYEGGDCRTSILTWNYNLDPAPYKSNFSGGKFYYGGGNAAYATNYIINAPEMYLIQAEAYTRLGQLADAQNAMLVVAKRNSAITSVSNLPASAAAMMDFIYEERARELFQEGLRMYDLRRWNIPCNLYAKAAPAVDFTFVSQRIGNLIFPIPQDEINAGFGVTQNQGWADTKPVEDGE